MAFNPYLQPQVMIITKFILHMSISIKTGQRKTSAWLLTQSLCPVKDILSSSAHPPEFCCQVSELLISIVI